MPSVFAGRQVQESKLLKELAQFVDRIHQGDCIAGMRGIPTESIDLAFADPPFNIGYKYDVYEDKMAYDEYLRWSSEWMKEVYRVLKSTGTFWLAIGDEYAAELKIEAQRAGFHTRNWVIWYYTFGVNCKNKFTRSHAHLFYFVKNPTEFTFNTEAIAVPSAGSWSMRTNVPTPRAETQTIPGSCVLRIVPRAFNPRKTPGIFLELPEPSKSEPDFMDARCPNSSWEGSFELARTRGGRYGSIFGKF